MWQHPLLQFLLLVLAVWIMLELLGKYLGLGAVVIVAVIAGLLAATIYLLRYLRPTAVQLYRQPVAKQWIGLVCRITKQQVPIDMESTKSDLMLREPRDFEWARSKLNERIKGQEAVVDLLVARLEENFVLRRRIADRSTGQPLGSFLFIAPPGIGKRHLALRLGQMLYRDGATSVLQVDQYGNDEAAVAGLFGGHSASTFGTGPPGGHLLSLLESRPNRTLILENIEAAGPKLQERLRLLLATGTCPNPSNKTPVNCCHCLFIFTTTQVPRGINLEKHAQLSPAQRHRELIETLTADSKLEPSFLLQIQEIFLWENPDDLTKARIILTLMVEECRKYDITLDYVAPEIIVEEVEAYLPTHGFALTETRVARRLRDSILKASQNRLDHLVLTPEMLSPMQ